MRRCLTAIILLGLLCSCSIPADVMLFNNAGMNALVTSGENAIAVAPGESQKITTVFRRFFSIEIGKASYNYELQSWPGEYEFTTGWGPWTKRVLSLQINGDGLIWVVTEGQKLPVPVSTSQAVGFPLEPLRTYLPIVRVAPVYPARALSQGLEGFVDLSFTVTTVGTVKDPIVLHSTSRLFERAALRALLKYKYKPRVVDGVPVEVPGVRARISFDLAD